MAVPLLLLTDGRFPAGGYAHSGGLEAAVEAGLAADGVPLYLAGRLRGVAAAESRLAVAAARAVSRFVIRCRYGEGDLSSAGR